MGKSTKHYWEPEAKDEKKVVGNRTVNGHKKNEEVEERYEGEQEAAQQAKGEPGGKDGEEVKAGSQKWDCYMRKKKKDTVKGGKKVNDDAHDNEKVKKHQASYKRTKGEQL